ncbi:MAG: hypothetical protein ACYDB4_19380 [Candidatus Dormibacteraceae bacterium]
MTSKRTLSAAEQRQREHAALKHGLQAKSSSALRVRNYRTTRLLTRLQEIMADLGRPIQEAELPASRAWAQLEVLATDLFAALQAGRGGEKALEQYLAVRRLQLTYANALGLTPAARAALAATVTGAIGLAAQLAQRRAALEAK